MLNTRLKNHLSVFTILLSMILVTMSGCARTEEPVIPCDFLEDNEITLTPYCEGIGIDIVSSAELTADKLQVGIKGENEIDYTFIDPELIRQGEDGSVRCDVIGISAGKYDLCLNYADSVTSYFAKEVTVEAYRRDGYAFFKYDDDGIGGYKNDGTPKDDAVIVYVTDATKNTVKAVIGGVERTGLIDILYGQSESDKPLIVRVIGEIGQPGWKYGNCGEGENGTALSDEFSDEYVVVKNSVTGETFGLPKETAYFSQSKLIDLGVNEYDTSRFEPIDGVGGGISYGEEVWESFETDPKTGEEITVTNRKEYVDIGFNNSYVSKVRNITVEGVGVGSGFTGWGWIDTNYDEEPSSALSAEVRNMVFRDYTGTCLMFTTGDYEQEGRIWIHNNTFYSGKNNWTFCDSEERYSKGDGSIDLRGFSNVTVSDNYFERTMKTGLVGWDMETVFSENYSFLRNYYYGCQYRTPLCSKSNVHVCNNYYYLSDIAVQARENAHIFCENNIFMEPKNAMVADRNVKYTDSKIKSFGDYCSFDPDEYPLVDFTATRDQKTEGSCPDNTGRDFNDFDLDPGLFYYNEAEKRTDMDVLTPLEVRDYVKLRAGALGTEKPYDKYTDFYTYFMPEF